MRIFTQRGEIKEIGAYKGRKRRTSWPL